jgi:hypothetical protein
MEEKVIIKSKIDKRLYVYSGIIGGLGLIVMICIFCDGGISAWFDYAFLYGLYSVEGLLSWGSLVLLILGLVLYYYGKRCSITVTDKRVYGIAKFGSRVDIPNDSISTISYIKINHGIGIGSSSGKISFPFIENNGEIHKAISALIIERQQRDNLSNTSNEKNDSDADEIRKFKKLLDDGVISQEEFIAKKNQILGLR